MIIKYLFHKPPTIAVGLHSTTATVSTLCSGAGVVEHGFKESTVVLGFLAGHDFFVFPLLAFVAA